MEVVRLNDGDIEEIDIFLSKIEFLPVQQSSIWADFQKELGFSSWKIGVKNSSNNLIAFVQVFEKKWPFGLKWLHVPRGPLLGRKIQNKKYKIFDLIFDEIKKLAKEKKSVFVRFDWSNDFELIPKTYNLQPSSSKNFPDTTLVLDLEKSE